MAANSVPPSLPWVSSKGGCSCDNTDCPQADWALFVYSSSSRAHVREASAPNMYEVPLPAPAQGMWDCVRLSGANPCLQLLLSQNAPWAHCCGQGGWWPLAAYPHPIPLDWGKTALAPRMGVSRGRDFKSTLEVMFGLLFIFPNKYLASLLPASELLQVLVSPRCPWTVLPSVRSGHGVIAPGKILSCCQEDLSQVLEAPLWYQYVLLNWERFWHSEPALGFLCAKCHFGKTQP